MRAPEAERMAVPILLVRLSFDGLLRPQQPVLESGGLRRIALAKLRDSLVALLVCGKLEAGTEITLRFAGLGRQAILLAAV